ncbi:MAG: pyruvate kinase alpha/beta domain-containing protein [Promethearchaeia archaeon]
MGDLKIESTYFEKMGPVNTEKALNIAKKYADELGIKEIVLASTTGGVAEKAVEFFDTDKYNVVIVTHSFYFTGAKKRTEFPEDKMEAIEKRGATIVTATHAMSGIERHIRKEYKQWCFVDLMAKFLREQFSQGTKVCIEIASMATDAGAIESIDDDIICVGGTGHGADTVCLINPAPTRLFDQLRVKAILAKPL